METKQNKNKDHGIWSHHFMANDGETMERVTDLILGGAKITADGDFSHENKRHLLLWRKVMINLNSISKSRDITDKVHLVKTMVFPVSMYSRKNWINKKKLNTEELMLLSYGVGEDSWVPWTARRSNQSILKEINPEYSLERLRLMVKLQYFGHLVWRADSLEKPLSETDHQPRLDAWDKCLDLVHWEEPKG